MTEKQIESELAICDAATPGPWRWGASHSECLCEDGIVDPNREAVMVNCGRGSGDPSIEDAEFIIAARTGYPEALRELQVAWKKLEVWEAALAVHEEREERRHRETMRSLRAAAEQRRGG